MAGETVSLDYTPHTYDKDGKVIESETPLYPGFQVAHIHEDGQYVWVVRRVTQRINELDARRGLVEQLHVYPGRYASQAEAEAAARAHFLADGPGDMGGRNPSHAQQLAQEAQQVHATHVAAEQDKKAAAEAIEHQKLVKALAALGIGTPPAAPSAHEG